MARSARAPRRLGAGDVPDARGVQPIVRFHTAHQSFELGRHDAIGRSI